ncbi:MAG: tRNA pseudouridine synthase A [Promethearchaeota archaeon]
MSINLKGKKRYLFKFFYIGSKRYYGSQRQLNFLTVENRIISALQHRNYIIDIKKSGIEFASRTDRFVSARGAAFSAFLEKPPILMEINSCLPNEIGVWAYAEINDNFLSRFNAIYRHYKYIVLYPLVFLQNKCELDIKLMKKACEALKGEHNFINFSKRLKEVKKTVRTMDDVKLSIDNNYIIFDFKSRAFLRQQIRRMVKKILELGAKKIDYDEFLALFDPSKEFSYQPAEPYGLILWDVKFTDNIEFRVDKKSLERMRNYFLEKELKFGLKHQLFRLLQQDNSSE